MQMAVGELGTAANHAQFNCWVYNYHVDVQNASACLESPANWPSGTKDNGNAADYYYLDNVYSGLSHSASYTYDHLNRLTLGQATGNSTYNLTFSYNQDGSGRYGNMTCVTNGQTHGLCPNYTFNAANNHINTSGFTYDAAGDLTSDGTHSYTSDAEGRTTTMDGGASANVIYNAWGWMAQNLGYATVYDAAGERIQSLEYGSNMVPRGYVPLVKWNSSFSDFVHSNALETSTFVTDHTGAVVQDETFYPWGQRWNLALNEQDGSFASMEQLVKTSGEETGTTQNRHYSEAYGRWLSPDPLAGDVTNPQSLNRYSYVLNNPCSLTDPMGLDGCSLNIAINGASALTGPQLSAAESQINAILGVASSWLSQGDSVSASFDFSGRADLKVNLTNSPGTPNPYNPDFPLGEDPRNGISANVYLNTIAVNFSGYGVNPYGSAFGQVVGSVIAHELGHHALGVPATHTQDFGIMSRPNGTGFTFNPSGFTYFGAFPTPLGQQFTPSQAQGLFNFCQSKHPSGSAAAGGGTNSHLPPDIPGEWYLYGWWLEQAGQQPPDTTTPR